MTSSRFEAIRVSFRQDKDGYLIVLRIHPNDIDGQTTLDQLGQRYYCTLNRVDENDQPITHKEKTAGERAVQMAGILCTDPAFREWMVKKGYAFDATEESVIKGMRDYLGVKSRKELSTNERAQDAFTLLLTEYGR